MVSGQGGDGDRLWEKFVNGDWEDFPDRKVWETLPDEEKESLKSDLRRLRERSDVFKGSLLRWLERVENLERLMVSIESRMG